MHCFEQKIAKRRWTFVIKGHALPTLRMELQKHRSLGNLVRADTSRFASLGDLRVRMDWGDRGATPFRHPK